MSPFEKALIKELLGIRKELHELNRQEVATPILMESPQVERQVKIDGSQAFESINQQAPTNLR
ncbi:hypothetical protein ACFP65_08260 [Marinilactibacillus sp. GCM10026970]|uniref:hypothetical protein n=1 Tax=Marinilactibacillus sp. GCM10026970 TaxID=3252642 RepID=UPI003618C460